MQLPVFHLDVSHGAFRQDCHGMHSAQEYPQQSAASLRWHSDPGSAPHTGDAGWHTQAYPYSSRPPGKTCWSWLAAARHRCVPGCSLVTSEKCEGEMTMAAFYSWRRSMQSWVLLNVGQTECLLSTYDSTVCFCFNVPSTMDMQMASGSSYPRRTLWTP